jgi:hypothetical protein
MLFNASYDRTPARILVRNAAVPVLHFEFCRCHDAFQVRAMSMVALRFPAILAYLMLFVP